MAGSAGGWVVVTAYALILPLDLALISLAFLLALSFYTRDRLDKIEQRADALAMPARTAWVQSHQMFLQRLVWLSFGGAIALVLTRPQALWPLMGGLGFALSYTLRWLPWQGRRVGWKHLPGLKMPFVALLWGLTTVITPASVYGLIWHKQTWLLFSVVSLLIMGQILLNDLRDEASDRQHGTQSLPVLLGTTKARWVGVILLVLAFGLGLSLKISLPIFFTSLYTIFILWGYQISTDTLWRPWIEAQGLIAAGLVLILQS